MNTKIYFAPMEGLTPLCFRRLQARYFGGTDKYFAPFISPNDQGATVKALRDVVPEANGYGPLVPQFLVNRAGPFILAARQAGDLGIREVNLNLGCPSGTVFSKGKGSALLADAGKLRALLDEIFNNVSLPVSAKTRIGIQSAEEFPALLDVLKDYPFSELILHPRTRSQAYSGRPDLTAYGQACESLKVPLCYNGNLYIPADGQDILSRFPQTMALMVGRGAIRDPSLPRQMKGGAVMTPAEFASFHRDLAEALRSQIGSDRQTILHLLGYWQHWQSLFPDSDKAMKAVRKARKMEEYFEAVGYLVNECPYQVTPEGEDKHAG